MIYRVRLEGGHESGDQLELEMRGLASQIAQVAYLEGYAGREMLAGEAVFESRRGDEVIEVGGSRYWFPKTGRFLFELKTYEGDFEALQPQEQPDFRAEVARVPYTMSGYFGGGSVLPKPERPGEETVWEPFNDAIVLPRMNGAPGGSLAARRGASDLMREIQSWTGVTRVASGSRVPEGWWVQVDLSGGAEPVRVEHVDLDQAVGLAWERTLERLEVNVGPAPA